MYEDEEFNFKSSVKRSKTQQVTSLTISEEDSELSMLAFENLETESFESDSWTESPDAMGGADNFLNGVFIPNPIVKVPTCFDIA